MPATNEINLGPSNSSTVNTQAVYEAQSSTGVTSGNYAQAIVSAASYDNFTTGSGFPVGVGYLDINPTANDTTLTGMLAGIAAQQIVIRNIGTTYNLILSVENASSDAVNRFTGQGDASLPPGADQTAYYYTSPNPRWSIG